MLVIYFPKNKSVLSEGPFCRSKSTPYKGCSETNEPGGETRQKYKVKGQLRCPHADSAWPGVVHCALLTGSVVSRLYNQASPGGKEINHFITLKGFIQTMHTH